MGRAQVSLRQGRSPHLLRFSCPSQMEVCVPVAGIGLTCGSLTFPSVAFLGLCPRSAQVKSPVSLVQAGGWHWAWRSPDLAGPPGPLCIAGTRPPGQKESVSDRNTSSCIADKLSSHREVPKLLALGLSCFLTTRDGTSPAPGPSFFVLEDVGALGHLTLSAEKLWDRGPVNSD